MEGMENIYPADWSTKGCFSKGVNVFFGRGGTVEEMLESDLPGGQERIWCSGSPSGVDQLGSDKTQSLVVRPTSAPIEPTYFPTEPLDVTPTSRSPQLPLW
eukprot:CAMPEP_0172544424 /NCGR_PEP_ID=MMETSP1067-20121228/14593_1 /TAXON_ID=265564 ORGANISM="Thalassiosira punctigera, Strain Tpunct2005C2" /NCGR_SAMPLE_ID=MMETSP1067 /ASSEMBLY_ACC=CAM_ASM_000444 /LENGTH=100 /DNA_ID=CAMNT_0013330989 /DNA_START=25 /DNA_END=324 /DNA_ORIENTATION=+